MQTCNSAAAIFCKRAFVQLTDSPNQLQSCHSATVHKCTTERTHMGTKIVAVTINKGGAGKTMISRSLATVAAEVGLTVLILDMDTQQNSTSWRRRRSDALSLPLVQFTTENDLAETLAPENFSFRGTAHTG